MLIELMRSENAWIFFYNTQWMSEYNDYKKYLQFYYSYCRDKKDTIISNIQWMPSVYYQKHMHALHDHAYITSKRKFF